nr:hypothetical protein [Tanacetum cinerariifolium]
MFLSCLHPLLIIDVAHLKGLYKGTDLVDVGMDGNNQIMSIAFGICKGENRHHAIALSIHDEFPLAFHDVCCRHLMMNLSLKKKKEKTVQPDAYHKLCEVGPQTCSRAHYPLVHYNYMTSNSMKSVNAFSVINRKIPVLKLAETYRAMVQNWCYKHQELAANMTYEITDWVANKVTKKDEKRHMGC